MIDICRANESNRKSGLPDTRTHIDIFAEHLPEASDRFEYFPGKSHVKCTWSKLLQLHLSSSYPPRCQKWSHRIIYSFLYVRKRLMCLIRTTETISIIPFQFLTDYFKIGLRDDTIRVKENEIFSRRLFHTIISGNTSPLILFIIIMHIELLRIIICNRAARQCRAILHQQNFKIMRSLITKTFQ